MSRDAEFLGRSGTYLHIRVRQAFMSPGVGPSETRLAIWDFDGADGGTETEEGHRGGAEAEAIALLGERSAQVV